MLSAGSLETEEQLIAMVVAMQLKSCAAKMGGLASRRSSSSADSLEDVAGGMATAGRRSLRWPAGADGHNVIPVALPSFAFPSPHVCDEAVQAGWRGDAADLACAQQSVRDFFQLIAVSLSVHASDGLITLQASDVLRRLPRSCLPASKEAVLLAERLGARPAAGDTSGPQLATGQQATGSSEAEEVAEKDNSESSEALVEDASGVMDV
jgi:hypothetical protein